MIITKYKQFNESIKSLLVGPTKEEVWKNLGLDGTEEEIWEKFGYDITFDTPEEFFLYLINGLEPSEDARWKSTHWSKDGKIKFKEDKSNKLIVLDSNDWYVFNKIFGMKREELTKYIKEMIIKHKVKDWKKYWVTYGNINNK